MILACLSQGVSTFGFRGEALSSLCALATLSVTTRTANTNPAQRLTYNHTGALVGTSPTARAVGTTVAVKDLFKTLPVRHKVQTGATEHILAELLSVLNVHAARKVTGQKVTYIQSHHMHAQHTVMNCCDILHTAPLLLFASSCLEYTCIAIWWQKAGSNAEIVACSSQN